ncbi:MAG: amidohydrolase family protein [Methylacidiphilales bacterium]|nr:amidohydrolase family protein [Candidatus Methylacidiphilales bacterium]
MLLRANTVLTLSGPPLEKADVRVTGNRITEVGPSLTPHEGEPVHDLPGHVLLPGLINAHCHLDYTGFKGSIFPTKSFTGWIRRINALKGSFSADDYLKSIDDGFQQLMRSGCTTVFNIEAFPDLFLRMKKPPIRTWWFLELIDIRTRLAGDDTLAGALAFFAEHKDWPGGFGLSPHSPYTASIELFRLAKHCSQDMGMRFTTHIAESIEEQEMFLYGQGPLYDFLTELGRDTEDCGQGSALSHLMDFGLLDEHCLAVHLNYLQEYDLKLLREHPLNIVHCPRCHAYFAHSRFPLERLRDAGCSISLGTDSLASNDMLDLRGEIRQLRKNYPNLTAEECLHMVTTAPARAIGLPGELGVIAPGAFADLIAFPLPANTNPYQAVLFSEGPPSFFMVDGEIKNPTNSG